MEFSLQNAILCCICVRNDIHGIFFEKNQQYIQVIIHVFRRRIFIFRSPWDIFFLASQKVKFVFKNVSELFMFFWNYFQHMCSHPSTMAFPKFCRDKRGLCIKHITLLTPTQSWLLYFSLCQNKCIRKSVHNTLNRLSQISSYLDQSDLEILTCSFRQSRITFLNSQF